VFEDFLGKTFWDDLGQYFTPTPVINLMVGVEHMILGKEVSEDG